MNVLDLLDTPDLEGKILSYLTRNGPTAINALPGALGDDDKKIRAALDALMEKGKVEINAEGQAKVSFGQSRSTRGS